MSRTAGLVEAPIASSRISGSCPRSMSLVRYMWSDGVSRFFQAFNVISLLMFDVCVLICVQKKCKIFSRMQNLECHEG